MKESLNDSGRNASPQFLKTDGGKTKSNSIEVPSISLPKGGGAIKGIDEKFAVNAVNGTASCSVPLPFSAARGAMPALSLSYNSGSGNGVFGLGWHLSLSSIKRKTDSGLPQYSDADDSDVFLFSEAEDLVPEFKKEAKKETDGSLVKDADGNIIFIFSADVNGDYIINEKDSPDSLHTIRFYKPRIEGLFARIERWMEKATGIIKWRVITKDNTTTLFGWTSQSILADPNDDSQTKIYEWLPEFVFDDKGNCTRYLYKQEDDINFDDSLLHNRNRKKEGSITYTNLYLEKIFYGNKTPYKKFGDAYPAEDNFLFSAVFDYGSLQDDDTIDTINNARWNFRPDAVSDYRAGFEVRTTRLCNRILFFHRFADEEYNGLVRSLNFEYDTLSVPGFTFLKSVTSVGYIKKGDSSYSHKSLPAMEFFYQQPEWNTEVKTVCVDYLVHAPVGIDEPPYQFVDLYNEGLSGILSEQANGWYYKHNLGERFIETKDTTELVFEEAKLVSPKPSFAGLGAHLQLADLDADGGRQIVNYASEPKGYFELDDNNNWQPFIHFKQLPNLDFHSPFTRMLDLNGDGKSELVISEDNVFTWYESEGRDGFKEAQKTAKPSDEERGAHLVFRDEKQTIFLADMGGDGLTDIVRIRNGEVCYWPNLGYGKFGAKVSMDNAPVFDSPDAFHPAYIRLADIDGSGTTDLIYLGKNKFSCWKNESGNRLSEPFHINSFPDIHNRANITVADLLGNGVACIVWSSPLQKDASAPMKYIDLMNGRKPHIMVKYVNNMGKEVCLEYTPSTKFYVDDKLAGKPWITKLHFPVHCVSKTITQDKITGHQFASLYKYHHGYYDHAEREFRGFGMVEQTDSESFEHWVKSGATNVTEEDLYQPPITTKTWFHTGAFIRKEIILKQFEQEYWYHAVEAANPEMALQDARIIPAKGIDKSVTEQLSAEEWREALRSCKSMALRSEIFSYDAPANPAPADIQIQLTPYSVATHNCIIELLQPKGKNKHAVFIVKESEAITYSYERNTTDPGIAHTLNIRLDDWGNVLESAAVVYPRLAPDHSLPQPTQDAQNKTIVIYTQNKFTNDVFSDDVYRLKLPSEVKTFELKNVSKTNSFYSLSDFENILTAAQSSLAEYHELNKPFAAGKAQRRLIEHGRTMYYNNDLITELALHQLQSHALPFQSYQLAYTPSLLADIYSAKITNPADFDVLMPLGKFVHCLDENSTPDNNWWIPSGSTQFIQDTETPAGAQDRFYMPISFTDPYGSKTLVKHDDYFIFIKQTEDALGNTSQADVFNFRTLSPQRMRDANNNLSEAISDELGLVKAMAVMGKDTNGDGIGEEADNLTSLTEITDAEAALIIDFFTVPDTPEGVTDSITLMQKARLLLRNATARFVYDFDAYKTGGKPAVAASIAREEHTTINPASPLQISFEYSGGSGNVVMKKGQAEPGRAKKTVVHSDGTYTLSDIDTSQLIPKQFRWIGNGRTVLNNKGNAVKQYEPYFSVTHRYEDIKELVESGVTPVMYYDAMSRLIKTKMPDGTFSKITFDSWQQTIYDANDTVLQSDWYKRRTDATRADFINDSKENQAAAKAAEHDDTPTQLHFDTLGRPVLQVQNNGKDAGGNDILLKTKIDLDTEGNLRSVTDARERLSNGNQGNLVGQYKYDMLGNMLYQDSIDAGKRWLLNNILGNPLRKWDERNHEFQYSYDALHRPTESKVTGGDGAVPLDNIFEKTVYGESLLTGIRTNGNRFNEAALQAKNILGKVIQHFDTGGLIDTPEYDFKGNPVSTTRKLFSKYKEVANWTSANLINDLEAQLFTFITEVDAVGRIKKQTAPDGSIITPSYNEAALLTGETVQHPGKAAAATYIEEINYNEKRQRSKIKYGNGVTTKFYYHTETYRLQHLDSKRQNGDPLQDLYYTYDAVGNITHVEDKNIPVVFFDNQKITGVSTYTYDALYRLTEATGRENNSAISFDDCDNWNDKSFLHELNPGDPVQARNYIQSYQYDAVGNIGEMKHRATGGSWTRTYDYEDNTNRLVSTHVGDIPVSTDYIKYQHHAAHGYLEKLPHLEAISWNFKEEVVLTTRQHCTNDNIPVTTYYQYDGGGQRIRKITENFSANNNPAKKEERIYIAGYEWYKKHTGANAGLERVSLSLLDEGHRFVMIETRNDTDDGTEKQLVRYQMHNHLGSASLELNEEAGVISYEEYHPFGTTAYQAINKAIKSAAKRYRYTGMERDEETGLAYHSARYYLPWLGRWLSADPIGIGDGVNVYAYCKNNPLMASDTSGTQATPPPPQLHLIEQFTVQTTATQTSFSQEANIRLYVRNMALMFGEDPTQYQAGHHPDTPQWSSPPGAIQLIGPQNRFANAIQSIQEAADRRAAVAAGSYYRTDRTHTGAPIPNGPPAALPPDVRRILSWTPPAALSSPAATPPATASGSAPRISVGPAQVSFPFAEQEAQLSLDFSRPAAQPAPSSPGSPSTPAVQLSFDLDAPRPASPRASSPAQTPRPAPVPRSGGGMGGAATTAATQIVPGAAEALMTTEALVPLAAQAGLPRLMAAAASGARAPGPGLIGGVVGAPLGVVAAGMARNAGLGEGASTGIGLGTALTAGAGVAIGAAAVGALVVSAPITVPLLAGAAIVGGLTAGFGYLMSRAMR